MSALASGLTTTALALAVIIPIDTWVLTDRRRSRCGQPVVLTLGGLRIAIPCSLARLVRRRAVRMRTAQRRKHRARDQREAVRPPST